MRNEVYHVWDRTTEAFQQHAMEPIFVDEAHAGAIMTTMHDIQHRKDSLRLKAELKSAHQETEKARLDTKEARQMALIMDLQIADLKKELKDAQAARDHAVADREQLEAANQQFLKAAGQDGAVAGIAELQHQLEQAKQELASRETASSTKMLVDHCEALARELQAKDQQLLKAQTAGSDPLLRTQLSNMSQEHDQAKNRERELLAEGLRLEDHYNELTQQVAISTAELEATLWVAQLEMEGCQKQCHREANFAKNQESEVDRFIGEVNRFQAENKDLRAELGNFRATPAVQAPPL